MDVKEIYYESLLTKMLFQKSSIKKIPLSGTFELSPVCNFDCRMCYVRKSPEEVKCHNRKMLNLEQWKKIADQAENAGMLYLLLTGGEPFLWPDFWELYMYLSKKGFLISINSNGSLIDEGVIEQLKERPPIRINITLYGASNATYEKLCKASNGFDKVDRAINLLKETGISVKLNCDMCYVRMSREEMEEVGRLRTMEEWTKTAEDMMRAGTLFVLLTGGEPLLYPHFRELYQKLRELGMIITINTNGTLIDEAWADFFAENKPRRINITLYGASNETYERLCHYPGGFDKAVNGIRLLRERNIDVKVNGSLAKANVDDRMKIIELGESLDAPVRIDTYMYPSVRERNHAYNNQARLDPEMAAKARVEVLRREMGEEVFAQYRKIQLDEAENTPEGEAVPGQMTCRAGKSSFVVNWQGEMRSCVVLDKPSIPLRDVEFEEAWKFTKKETESLRISARCSSCKLRKVCNTCVAAAIAETGKADGVPEYLCRYTEATVRYLKETSKK